MSASAPGRLALFTVRTCLAIVFTSSLLTGALAHDYKAGDLQIKHPWSRATVSVAKVAGGYFTVVNTGAEPDRLLAAKAEIAESTELHQMAMKDGVMSMRAVDGGIEIPANGELALEPGGKGAGYHVMFNGLKKPLAGGEKFPGTLTFEKAGTIAVEFAVEGMGTTGDDHSQHGG